MLSAAGENPIGKRLWVSVRWAGGGMEVEIVRCGGRREVRVARCDTRATIYIPHPQLPIGLMTFVVRTGLEPTSLASSVGAAVRSIDPELPVADA